MTVTSWGDLIQYLVWSFPLVGAMGVLTWRLSSVKIGDDRLLDGLGGQPAPLVKLLESPDARLRFQLVQTILRLNPQIPLPAPVA